MRGRDAALAAPICPQLGQAIRVSMSVTTAAAGAGARGRPGSPGRRFCHRYSEHGYFLAVEDVFKQWELLQTVGHRDQRQSEQKG